MEPEYSSVDQLVANSFQNTQNLFVGHYYAPFATDTVSQQLKLRTKLDMDFRHVKDLTLPVTSQADQVNQQIEDVDIEMEPASPPKSGPITPESAVGKTKQSNSQALALTSNKNQALTIPSHRRPPVWHAPWEIMRVSCEKIKIQKR